MAKTTFKDFLLSFLEIADEKQKCNLIETHRTLLEYYIKNYFFKNLDESHNLLKFLNNNSLYLNNAALELGLGDNDDFTTDICNQANKTGKYKELTDFEILTSDINTV